MFRIASSSDSLLRAFATLSIGRQTASICSVPRNHLVCNHQPANEKHRGPALLRPVVPTLCNVRQTSFFNKLPAEQIWKGVISVSNAGKKRGRGKGSGRITAKDLNRGQMIGFGKANIVWPGLSAPVIRGRELVQQQKLPEDKEREAKLRRIRDEMVNFKRLKLSPLERGWSGSKMPGRSIGPPDAIGEDEFVGFDTKCLELKAVVNMKGNHGRKRRVSAMVVTGNGNGLAGFGFGKAIEGRAALRQAKNRAGQKLMHFDLCNGHTVFHDFHCQFGATKLFVERKPEGFGLKCHRAIRTVCEVLGIKDLRAKCEGSTNVQHVVKAFFIGLLKQKDHQQIAEEKGLHVVEFRPENRNFPKVVASPTVCRTERELENNEILDFTQYCMDGKIQLQKKKFPPFYTKFRSWEIYLKKQEYLRNQDNVRLRMMAETGEVRSYLTEKYPECRMGPGPKDE
ncbi:28S ribosomal protein S5, mitochondrial [Anopheles moucheti]|uniref:28S ribosomal protein S5, mitochondrial n=1 Tax=Anopheles moucheti TaxID=186751 RepID=UPI0022F0B52B|nr:28S ribosomal protein S5, mitochondrial [Anopheles moucheti]